MYSFYTGPSMTWKRVSAMGKLFADPVPEARPAVGTGATAVVNAVLVTAAVPTDILRRLVARLRMALHASTVTTR